MSVAQVREALEKVGKLITEQPQKAKAKNAPATARLLEGLRCEVKGPNGETAYTDMTPAMGGAASAPNPGWLFRAALASCTSTAIAMRAARQGISLTTLEITVESSSDIRGLLGTDEKVSAGLSQLVCRVKIGAEGVAPERLRGLAEWGDRHSPIACTTRDTPDLAVEVEIA